MSSAPIKQKLIVIVMAVMVALLHFLKGPQYHGPWPGFVNGYLIDILLPFVMVLVLGVANQTIQYSVLARSTFVFMVGAITETMQFFGVPLFGRTFDPLDYLMFAIGISLAIAFEKFIWCRCYMSSSPHSPPVE